MGCSFPGLPHGLKWNRPRGFAGANAGQTSRYQKDSAMTNRAVRLRRVLYAAAVLSCLSLLPAISLYAQRLPQTVTPEHYALTLTPDLKAATFTGVEQIDLEVKEPTTTITLNSAEIE